MKRLACLALATSLTAFSASALALETLEDDVLASTTGQDGVTIDIGTAASGLPYSTVIHDSNGFTGFTSPGALVIGRPLAAGDHIASSITVPSGQFIKVLMDATGDVDSGTALNQPALDINISIPAGTVLHTGTLSIAKSNGLGVAVTNQSNVILNDLAITLGATSTLSLNMLLGNEVAATGTSLSQMMRVTGSLAGGLSLSNFAIRDATAVDSNGVAVRAASILIDNAGASTALDLDVQVDVIPTGIRASVVTFGTGGADINIKDIRLGDTTTTPMGTLDIKGLNVAGAILKIYGH